LSFFINIHYVLPGFDILLAEAWAHHASVRLKAKLSEGLDAGFHTVWVSLNECLRGGKGWEK
jgi:hypothetical protein